MLLIPSTSWAQWTLAEGKNRVYLELFGNGGLYSINYEREVLGGVALRLGYGSWTTDSLFSDVETSLWTVPVTVQAILGLDAHHIEFGGGIVFGNRDRENLAVASGRFTSLTGIIGYRYQSPGRGFLFRAAATPFYGFGEEDTAYPEKGFFPSVGVSFGYAF